MKHDFPSHSELEKTLFDQLGAMDIFSHRRFYLIGSISTRQSSSTFRHEYCHGLYYCDARYRREVHKITRHYPVKGFRRALLSKGYAKHVLDDEVHAYAMTGYDNFFVSKEMRRLASAFVPLRKAVLSEIPPLT